MDDQLPEKRSKSPFVIAALFALIILAICFQPVTMVDREATMHAVVKNRLKQLGLAVYNYSDSEFASPFLASPETPEEREWSWETRLLPHLEAGPAYDLIDFTQPWNATANKEAFSTKVWGFESPAASEPTRTDDGYEVNHYSANSHIRGLEITFTVRGLSDGMTTTILMGEAYGNFQPWCQPGNYRDPLDGINQSPDGFGSTLREEAKWYESQGKAGCRFLFADGRVKFVAEDTDPEVLRRSALPNDGKEVSDF